MSESAAHYRSLAQARVSKRLSGQMMASVQHPQPSRKRAKPAAKPHPRGRRVGERGPCRARRPAPPPSPPPLGR